VWCKKWSNCASGVGQKVRLPVLLGIRFHPKTCGSATLAVTVQKKSLMDRRIRSLETLNSQWWTMDKCAQWTNAPFPKYMKVCQSNCTTPVFIQCRCAFPKISENQRFPVPVEFQLIYWSLRLLVQLLWTSPRTAAEVWKFTCSIKIDVLLPGVVVLEQRVCQLTLSSKVPLQYSAWTALAHTLCLLRL